MAEIVIATERLNLRLWEPGDLEHWLTLLNTPEVMDHLGGVRTPQEVTEKFDKLWNGWERDGFSFLAVTLKDGTFLGTCGIARIENEGAPVGLLGQVQIGWQLRADHWGQGYATEAARAAMAMAFERCNIATLFAQTADRNRSSWRIMEKLGMHRHRALDYDDPRFETRDNPTIIYRLTQADWRAARAA